MRTLFLFRDSYDAHYILQKLEGENLVSSIILEKGSRAKKTKLRTMFQKTSFLRYPLIIIDLAALIVYSSLAVSLMKKKLGNVVYPKEKISLFVDDANDKECREYIKKFNPDIIFIYGTAIVKQEFLYALTCPVFNIHSGILPQYRNVHSDFWAYIQKDFENIGITILYVDSGIDSGDIALQKRIQYKRSDSLIDIKVKNLSLIPQLIMQIIKNYKQNKLDRIKQNKKLKGFYPTPGFIEIIKLLNKGMYKL